MPRLDAAHTRTYISWYEMMRRCSDPTEQQFADYGGRGITVCDRWLTFTNFREDMGDRPAGLTLEREDNEAGYDLDNCRWATRAEQQRNRRNTIRVTHAGREMCLRDACSSDAHYQAILRRMDKQGMTFNEAMADRGLT